MSVPANTLVTASSSFPMSIVETISINAVYSPDTASVDFGFVVPDGVFYFVNTTSGNFDESI